MRSSFFVFLTYLSQQSSLPQNSLSFIHFYTPILFLSCSIIRPVLLRHLKRFQSYISVERSAPQYNISYMEQVINILKQNEAESFASLEAKSIVLIEKRPGVAEPTQRARNIIQGTISNQVSSEKFGAIMGKLDELGIDADISQALEPGAPFADYGELDNVLDEGKTQLKHNPGEVLLVDVWATWCGPCQRPMQHNQEMLTKNEAAWAGKVRIVGVSVDDEKETIVTRVNGKGWTKVQHLTLRGWNGDHKLIKDFSISGIPFICLVDKFGKINYTGHPSTIPLEDRINQLIAQEKEQESAAPAAPSPPNNEDDAKKLSALLTVQKIKNTFGDTELICIKSSVDTTYEKGKTSGKASVEIFAYEHDKATLEKVSKVFGELKGVEVKIQEVKTVEVPYPEHPKCWQCGAALTFPYYWLYWEQGTHFGCVTCVEKASAVPGHHYHYQKNSILLTDKWERVSLKRLGSNFQPQKVQDVQGGHMFGCNGCGGTSGLGSARYICIGCRSEPNFKGDYVDLCVDCKQKAVKAEEEIMTQLSAESHLKSHPLLRVLYSVKGYYDF